MLKVKGEWILCNHCDKRLMRIEGDIYDIKGIEIKCPRCKELVSLKKQIKTQVWRKENV